MDMGQSKLIADMNFKAKYGLFGQIMDYLAIKGQFGAAIGNILFAGVESCCTMRMASLSRRVSTPRRRSWSSSSGTALVVLENDLVKELGSLSYQRNRIPISLALGQ